MKTHLIPSRRTNNMAISAKARKTFALIAKSNPKTIKKILKTVDKDFIRAISEVSLNILQGVIPLHHQKKKQLSKYKSNLRGLVKKDTVTNKKKIAQRGGFLKTLVSIAIPLIIKSISTLNAKSNARRKKRILAMKKRY